jgi:hypothetical protein
VTEPRISDVCEAVLPTEQGCFMETRQIQNIITRIGTAAALYSDSNPQVHGDVDPWAVLGVFLVKTAWRKYALAAHYLCCIVEQCLQQRYSISHGIYVCVVKVCVYKDCYFALMFKFTFQALWGSFPLSCLVLVSFSSLIPVVSVLVSVPFGGWLFLYKACDTIESFCVV